MFTVIAFYHFTRFNEPNRMQPCLMKECKKYNIRGIQIEKPILRTWTLYNDKSGSRVKDYDSMIIKAEYLTQELEKKHPKPNWYSSIMIQ